VHVLHVAQPTTGGVARYLDQVTVDQAERGWTVTVAAPADLLDRTRADAARWVAWPAARSPGPSTLDEARRLRSLIRAARPDVVHLHSAKAGMAGRLALRGALPTVFHPHAWSWLAARGAQAVTAQAWERHAARRWTSLLVCVSEGEAETGRRAGVDGPLVVVRNGVDLTYHRATNDADRRAARAALGVPALARLAVCVGRSTPQKGQDVLLRAWPQVRAGCSAARLLLVGDVQDGGARVPPGLDGVVQRASVADVRPCYAAADVVVIPSRWEGLSLTALEALAAARSVVASDVPGLADAVTAGTGALVPPEDPDALAAALTLRLRDPERVRREGSAARRRAAEFDVRKTTERLAELTRALVTGQAD
jgi:glycosyltransferase involved in cell wall biosynthesis